MALHLAKIEHGNNTPYQATNLLHLAHQCTDHHAVPLYNGLPTHSGGATLVCPTTRVTATSLTPAVSYDTVNIWELTTAWDAAITIPPYLFSYHTLQAHATLTADRIWTTPSAAVLIAYLNSTTHEPLLGGVYYEFYLGSDGGRITPAAGAGCTLRGNPAGTVSDGTHRRLAVRITDCRPGSEAYELYLF